MSKYVVYLHITADTNTVFYVGAGVPSRPYYRCRPDKWKEMVAKHGYRVEIVKTCMSLEMAHKWETHYIMKYGRLDIGTGTLLNLTNGAKGRQGAKHPPEEVAKNKARNLERLQSMEHRMLSIGANNYLSRKVQCTVTGQVRDCARALAKELNVNYNTILGWLTKRYKCPDWFTWIYITPAKNGKNFKNGRKIN